MVTPTLLSDATGDGRMDFMFRVGTSNYLHGVTQEPGANGVPAGWPRGARIGIPAVDHLFGKHKGKQLDNIVFVDFEHTKHKTESITDTWQEFRDVNGDGRADVIVANELPETWVYYINSPHPDNPSWTRWVRQEHSVEHLADTLVAAGHRLDSSWESGKCMCR